MIEVLLVVVYIALLAWLISKVGANAFGGLATTIARSDTSQ